MTEHPPAKPINRVNLALWVGLAIVLLVIFLAVAAPLVAPADPMQENWITEIDGRFVRPPFPPFKLAEFPMGSDDIGRDLLSRVIWAVRPSLIMVLLIAAIRQVLGITIGLLAGWASGFFSRLLDTLITTFLSVPVLFVALFFIAAIGANLGIWAFVLGISVTGWAETARIVQAQTRGIKSQLFVEASRAMGASSGQILVNHVLPVVMVLVWVLLAFEISSAMLTVAGLGFLGYFINSVWIPVRDFVDLRATGRPELGQMLGSTNALQYPWAALGAGSMIMIIVFGFNLLGEGLRRELVPEESRRSRTGISAIGYWLENKLYNAITRWRQVASVGFPALGLVIVIAVAGWFFAQSQRTAKAQAVIQIPGGHLWAASRHDAQGTRWTESLGPIAPSKLWEFWSISGFTGGPVVAADGTIFVNSASQLLLAVNPDGSYKWASSLPEIPYGTPAIYKDGSIAVADYIGGMHVVDSTGTLLWSMPARIESKTIANPIVSEKDLVYLVTDNTISAISLDNRLIWEIYLPTYSYANPQPRLSFDENYLFFEGFVMDALTGAMVETPTILPLDLFISGADGRNYLRGTRTLQEVFTTAAGIEYKPKAQFELLALGLGQRFPRDTGVTPDGYIWLYYAGAYEYEKIILTEGDGSSPRVINPPIQNGDLVAIDRSLNAYICGVHEVSSNASEPWCRSYQMKSSQQLWEIKLQGFPNGAALVPGRLYIVIGQKIVAFGDS
jgi:peptide/nickel transport system permease protein